MINNAKLFAESCKNELARYMEASTETERRAVLNRDTVKGLMWAIDFCKGLDHEVMTEPELKHAVRLTRFRGKVCPVYNG